MPDDQTIPPALTPEEWTFPHHAMWMSPKMGIVAHVRVESEQEDGTGPMLLSIRTPQAVCRGWDGKTLTIHEADDRHALAALCLYGQPFGFTRTEARTLRQLARHIRVTATRGGGEPYDPVERIAAKIEALLPPSP